MKIRTRSIIFMILIAFVILPVLLILLLYVNHLYSLGNIKRNTDIGLQFLKKNNCSIYIIAHNLFELNVNSGDWHERPLSCYAKNKTDATISNGLVYFYDNGAIRIASTNSENVSRILVDQCFRASNFAVSKDNKKLAYQDYLDDMFQKSAIMVFDLEAETKSKVFEFSGVADSISWACSDNNHLFFSKSGKIKKLDLTNGQSKTIAEGYWVKAVSENTLVYWRNDGKYSACYKKDFVTNSEKELFRTKEPLKGVDWDPTGRFVVASIPTYTGKFFNFWHHTTTPFVWDTYTQKQYRLPYCDYYSGCIFWKNIKN